MKPDLRHLYGFQVIEPRAGLVMPKLPTIEEHWYAPGYGLLFNAEWEGRSFTSLTNPEHYSKDIDVESWAWWHLFSHTHPFDIVTVCLNEDPSNCWAVLATEDPGSWADIEVPLLWHWTDERKGE